MGAAFVLGRLILGGYYLFSAFHHFSNVRGLAGYAAVRGVPMPTVAVVVAGLLLAIAGVTFLIGVLPRAGIGALVLFFLPVTFTMHAFWTDIDPAARAMNLINFTKNMALLGSSLMFLAIPEPWPYSFGRRIHLRTRVPA